MKKLLITLLVISAALSVAVSATAQTASQAGSTPRSAAQAKRQKAMDAILAKLNLTDEQKAKMKAQSVKHAEAQKALRADVKAGKVTPEDAKTKSKELRKANQEAIKAILTPDQAKQYAALVKEAREKARAEAAKKTGTSGTAGAGSGGN